MKKLFAAFLFLIPIVCFCQKRQSSPFEDFNDWNLRDRPSIIYVFASWCSATEESFTKSKDTLLKYRNYFNLIVLYDTSDFSFKTLAGKELLLTADKRIPLTDFYPSKLVKVVDNKKLTEDFNKVFGTKFFRLGPSSMILIDANGMLISAIPPFEREKELSKYLRTLIN